MVGKLALARRLLMAQLCYVNQLVASTALSEAR
jgi:hypothetical protein